jgi:hypothetical protein
VQCCGSESVRIGIILPDLDLHPGPADTEPDTGPDPYPFQPENFKYSQIRKNFTLTRNIIQCRLAMLGKNKKNDQIISTCVKLWVESGSGFGSRSASKWKVVSESGSASKR